jgi:uroporphyrinogen-III synthase
LRLLLTRPVFEAQRTAAALRARGHEVTFAPMLEIENIPGVSIGAGPWSAVLLTSGNAARAIAKHPQRDSLTSLRCFAVGVQTAAAANRAGFRDVVSANGDGGDLAEVILRHVASDAAPLLYLAGDDRARDMAAALAPSGLRLEIAVVYRAGAATAFTDEINDGLKAGRFGGALHYSRRSTEIFIACAREGNVTAAAASLKHFCLSKRAAEPLSAIGAVHVAVAARPDEAAMLELIS